MRKIAPKQTRSGRSAHDASVGDNRIALEKATDSIALDSLHRQNILEEPEERTRRFAGAATSGGWTSRAPNPIEVEEETSSAFDVCVSMKMNQKRLQTRAVSGDFLSRSKGVSQNSVRGTDHNNNNAYLYSSLCKKSIRSKALCIKGSLKK